MQRKLLELKRKLFMVMGIMLCFICFTGITVNAAELNAETLGDSEETVISAEERERSVFLDSSKERIPNFFVVEAVVEGSSGSDKIKIIAHNIGIDTIDKISCKVKITDNKGLVQYNKVVSFTDVTPLFSPVYNIYVKNWKKIEIPLKHEVSGTLELTWSMGKVPDILPFGLLGLYLKFN